MRERDLVWPPPAEDVDAISIVDLDESNAERPRLKTTFGDYRRLTAHAPAQPASSEPPPLPDELPAPVFFDAPAPADARQLEAEPEFPAVTVTVHATDIALEDEERAAEPDDAVADEAAEARPPVENIPLEQIVPFRVDAEARLQNPDAAVAARSAWLALFVAASLALATYSEFHGRPELLGAAADVGEAVPEPGPAPLVTPPPSTAAVAPPAPSRPVASSRPAVDVQPQTPRPVREPQPKPVPAAATVVATPVPRTRPQVAPIVPSPRPERVAIAPAPEPARSMPPAATPAPRPESARPAATTAAALPPPPEPVKIPEPSTPEPVTAVLVDRGRDDEADIRTTLTRFRTAYSQLNASAAREVWPSVDARALERAFQGLKSQELRFDSCNLTVDGERARAACKGRATYVPRIGDQSPRRASREWNFELRKTDERWTIASARSL